MHLSWLTDIVFPAGLILLAFILRMWDTGEWGQGREGGGVGEGAKRRENKVRGEKETLKVPNNRPRKKKILICKIGENTVLTI